MFNVKMEEVLQSNMTAIWVLRLVLFNIIRKTQYNIQ